MGYLLGIAAIILLYSIGGKKSQGALAPKSDSTGALPPSSLTDFVRQVIEDQGASKADLLKAADQAKEAGYPKLAIALKARAEGAKQLIPSPWGDVTGSAWTRFCSVIANGHKAGTVNPKGFFGIFQIGVRRLVDLGIMANPKSRNITDPNGTTTRIWEGKWVQPQEQFLADPQYQYKLFVKSMELYRNIISEKYKKVIGLNIEGQPATMSGLLALCHTAGSEGMYKWLTNGNLRTKFTWVTEAYKKANGIF